MSSQGNFTSSRCTDHRFEPNVACRVIEEFSLEDGLKDDLKNISLFCRVNGANIRPDDLVGDDFISRLSNRWEANGYRQILDDDDDDLSDWKYWFTALSIICGKGLMQTDNKSYGKNSVRYGDAPHLDNRLRHRRKRN